MRIAKISFPLFTVVDPHTGFRLRPNAEGWHRGEGNVYLRMNSHGLRNKEISVKKPENTFRIAVFGDSFTEARQVKMEDAFPAIIENELQDCSAFNTQEVEVINFGVSSYGTAQEYLLMHHYAWKYDPDLIVLAFFAGNDVRSNSTVSEVNPQSPYFIYENGILKPDFSFRESDFYKFQTKTINRVLGEVINRSRTFQIINRVRNILNQRKIRIETLQQTDEPVFEEGIDVANIYKKPNNPIWEEAWNITEGIILKMAEEVRDHQSTFLLVSIGVNPQTSPDSSIREKIMETLEIPDIFYPEQRLNTFARKEGISLLTLAEPLQEYAVQNQIHLSGYFATDPDATGGHWNEKAHKKAGELIAERICDTLR